MNSSSAGMAHPTQFIPRNLPVGWRFHPTDEELLIDYLKPKILGDPIFGTDVQEINISDCNPQDLFGQLSGNSGEKEKYFFSPCEYYEKSKLRKRKVKDGGYWKCTGDPRPITLGDSDELIGTKRSLVYQNHDTTEMIKTEYTWTAKLDRPIMGNYVIYKFNEKSKKKKAASKKLMKVEPDCQNTRQNKKARNGESSNCNTASASAFKNKNLKDTITIPACVEGEQSNHMASDLENQYPNIMTAISTNEKGGESSCPEASDFDNQNLYEMNSTSASKGATSSPMGYHIGNQNSDQITTVSTNNKGGRSCRVVFDAENLIPNKMSDNSLHKKSEPSCLRASCDENQNSYEMTTFSSHNKDETSFLMNQNPIDMSTKLFYDKGKTSCLTTSDFEIQNPNKKMDISASVEGQWSPVIDVPSDFDNQNQYQQTDVSLLKDYHSLTMASKVGETTFQEVQSQYKKADMPNLKDYAGSLKTSNAEDTTTFEEVHSQCKKTDMANLEDHLGLVIASDVGEDTSVVDPQQLQDMIAFLNLELQQPIQADESPTLCGSCMTSYEKTNLPTAGNNQLPLTSSDGEESIDLVKDDQQLEELLAYFN